MQIIADSESKTVIQPALRILNDLAPEAIAMTKVLVSDMSRSYINAWNDEFPNLPIKHIKCSWHVVNAWKRKLSSSDKELFDRICKLRLLTSIDDFNIEYDKLEQE